MDLEIITLPDTVRTIGENAITAEFFKPGNYDKDIR